MPRLTSPLLPPSPRKHLSEALHALHRRAGWPSVRELARALDGAASSSRIHDAFTKPRLPGWGLVEALVAELARRIPGGMPAEQEVHRFHTLWDAAAEELIGSGNELDARREAARKLGEGGDAAGAAFAFAELVKDQTRVLGADNPNTLDARHQEAYLLGEAGDAAGV